MSVVLGFGGWNPMVGGVGVGVGILEMEFELEHFRVGKIYSGRVE